MIETGTWGHIRYGAMYIFLADVLTSSESINLEILASMKRVFEQADADGSGQLDIDEFVEAFRGTSIIT